MSILESIGGAIATGLIFLAGLLGYNPEPTYVPTDDLALGADTVLPLGGQTYTLAGSGISSSATSFTLTSFTIPQNGKKIQDSEMGDTFFVTFETGSRQRQEFASCTTVVQNVDNTATISGCVRGLSPVSPYTASSSLQFPHGGGTSVIFSNSPQFYNQFAAKGNDETITGQWTFDVFPITPSSSPATATTTGSVELATGAEAASSTLSGDIAASKLALHTGIATSSAPTSGNVVVVTGDDGNIDIGFLPGGIVDIQTFTSTTSTQTWTKATGTSMVDVILIGGGGGGGSGGSEATAGQAQGGSGGAGGAYVIHRLSATFLSATSAVTVGAGGVGGVSVSGDSTGNSGTSGATSSFAGFIHARGGTGGAPGQNGASVALGATSSESISFSSITTASITSCGASANGGVSAIGENAPSCRIAVPSGGGGGGGTDGTTNRAGGTGGSLIGFMSMAGGTAGVAGGAGGVGTSASSSNPLGGTGGGGGGSDVNGNAGGAGGAGGSYGGGGGGGGGSEASTSGVGGKGADGIVVVISYR